MGDGFCSINQLILYIKIVAKELIGGDMGYCIFSVM